MSTSLHRTLILGCLGLVALYARPAWEALTTGVPRTAAAARSLTAEAPEGSDPEPASELLGLVPDLDDPDGETVIAGRS